jgi:chorismate dehydratase
MQKIKVGAVSYLNTKPLIYGFQKGLMNDRLEMVTDYPSKLAQMLVNGEIDMGLVPVAIIPQLRESHIIGHYCIGSTGAVASVGLFSEVPIEQVEEVMLDYQSRTSVALARILFSEYWKCKPVFTPGGENFSEQIKGRKAAVVIGDRALRQRSLSSHVYDFGEAWTSLTGLPFVYAAWVSNKPLDPSFIEEFDHTTGMGLDNLEEVINQNPFPIYDLHKYFGQNISYVLDSVKYKGLDLFLKKLGHHLPG